MIYSIEKEKAWLYINNISVFVFFSIFFLQMCTGSSLFFAVNMFVIPLYLVQKIELTKDNRFQCLSLLGMYSFFLLANIRNQNIFAGCFFNLQYIFVTFLICQKNISHRVFLINLVMQVLLLAPKIISGINPNMLLQGGSRNVVSALTINQTLLYYGHVYKNGKKIWLWPAILNLFFCLICIGRSGIIVSAGIFIIVFTYLFFQKRLKQKLIAIIFIILGTSVLGKTLLPKLSVFNFNNGSMNFIQNFQKDGIKSEGRDQIKNEYFDILNHDFSSILFGIKNIESNPIFRSYDGNLHNSFLTLHTSYSLIGFLFFILLVFFDSFLCLNNKNKFMLFLLFCSLIRISKDILAFPGFYDPFIYFSSFYLFGSFRNNKIIRKYYIIK